MSARALPVRHGEVVLPAAEFERARRILVVGADNLLRNAGSVHYTMDISERWAAIAHNLRIARSQFLRLGDCSSTFTWLLMNALTHVHFHADLLNGSGYRSGYTGTLISHGRPVHHDASLRLGDAVFYGVQGHLPDGTPIPEHVVMALGGGVVFSHGSDAGPFKLGLDYRGDRLKGMARRYFTHA